MARLRGPGGCPWDREQTFDTIKPYTLEETYEVLDAIDRHPCKTDTPNWNKPSKSKITARFPTKCSFKS